MGGSKPAHSIGAQGDGRHTEMMNEGDEHVPEERRAGVKSERSMMIGKLMEGANVGLGTGRRCCPPSLFILLTASSRSQCPIMSGGL